MALLDTFVEFCVFLVSITRLTAIIETWIPPKLSDINDKLHGMMQQHCSMDVHYDIER